MANDLKKTQLVSNYTAESIQYECPFTATIPNRNNEIGAEPRGSVKTGASVDIIRKWVPKKQGGRGSNVATFNARDIKEDTVKLTVDSYYRGHTAIPTAESAEDLCDWVDRVQRPELETMGNGAEADNLLDACQQASQAIVAGAAASFDDLLDARPFIREMGCTGKLFAIGGSGVMTSIVKGNLSNYNPASEISKQYTKGIINQGAGFDRIMESENLPIHSNGAPNSGAYDSATGLTPLGLINGAVANGATSLVIDGVSGSDGTVTKGTKIAVADVNGVNGVTRASLGRLRYFTVAADATISTAAGTITVTEQIVDGSGTTVDAAFQNVTALPADNAVIYIVGKASQDYKQILCYSEGTYTVGSLNLTLPSAGAKATWGEATGGFRVRLLETYDKQEDENVWRIDMKTGFATIRPNWGLVILQES